MRPPPCWKERKHVAEVAPLEVVEVDDLRVSAHPPKVLRHVGVGNEDGIRAFLGHPHGPAVGQLEDRLQNEERSDLPRDPRLHRRDDEPLDARATLLESLGEGGRSL